MRNPVARYLRTYNKSSKIPDKRQSILEELDYKEIDMREDRAVKVLHTASNFPISIYRKNSTTIILETQYDTYRLTNGEVEELGFLLEEVLSE